MRQKFAVVLALLISACGRDPLDMRLAELDLSDAAVVEEVAGTLSPSDKRPFIVYSTVHAPSAAGFCGKRLVFGDGNEPQTIGEAIILTLRREAQLRAASLEAKKPKSAAELLREEWDNLIVRREFLITRQSALLVDQGSAARGTQQWASLEEQMSKLNKKLSALRLNMEAADSN